jgi:hypothetical protein
MSKPVATFALHVPRHHKLMVYIWPTLTAMRARISAFIGKTEARRTLGLFHAPDTRIGPRNVVRNIVVGEIHLTQGQFGAGIFAHELQHFISWWSDIKDFKPTDADWERVSNLAGRLTTQFWNKYYECFD